MSSIDLTNLTPYLGYSADGLPLAADATPLQSTNFNNCWTVLEKEARGLLDANNFNTTRIPYDATRKGSLVQGQSVGGTANLDYLAVSYSHVDQGDWYSGLVGVSLKLPAGQGSADRKPLVQ